MDFLVLLPNPAGYSHKPSATSVPRVGVGGGGFDVRRVELQGTTTLFQAQYTVGPQGFAYLRDFVAAYEASGAPFHALLVGLPTNGRYPLQRFVCDIVPSTHRVSEIDGRRFVVSMTLEGHQDDAPFLTSTPYPRLFVEAIETGLSVDRGDLQSTLFTDAVSADLALLEGSMGEPIHDYDMLAEAIDNGLTLIEGGLRSPIRSYNDYPPETIEAGLALQSGGLKVVLITYTGNKPEAIDADLTLISGTLT